MRTIADEVEWRQWSSRSVEAVHLPTGLSVFWDGTAKRWPSALAQLTRLVSVRSAAIDADRSERAALVANAGGGDIYQRRLDRIRAAWPERIPARLVFAQDSDGWAIGVLELPEIAEDVARLTLPCFAPRSLRVTKPPGPSMPSVTLERVDAAFWEVVSVRDGGQLEACGRFVSGLDAGEDRRKVGKLFDLRRVIQRELDYLPRSPSVYARVFQKLRAGR